jgi:hypothetical protein
MAFYLRYSTELSESLISVYCSSVHGYEDMVMELETELSWLVNERLMNQ